jgi:hypothetical protein
MPEISSSGNSGGAGFHPLLPLALKLLAAVLFVYWGLSHLIYPEWYIIRLMGISQYDPTNAYDLFATNLLGVLNVALAITIWRASADPARYRIIIDMVLIISAGTLAVFVFSILRRGISQLEWLNAALIAVAMLALLVMYPRSEKGKKPSVI